MSTIPFTPTKTNPFVCHPSAKSATVTPTGGLTLRGLPSTDWWHTPEPDPADRRTGSFYALPIEGNRDFQCGVWIRGEWGIQYDQGCLMIMASDADDLSGDWLKTGVELDGGKEWIGVVVASPWSDWSIMQAAHSTSTLNSGAFAVYIQATRTGATVTIRYAFSSDPSPTQAPKAEELIMMREIKAFAIDAAGLPKTSVGGMWRVGVMACGPQNTEGTVATFEGFSFQYL